MATGDVVFEADNANITNLGKSTSYYYGSELVYETVDIGGALSLKNNYDALTGTTFLNNFDPEKTYKITVKEV